MITINEPITEDVRADLAELSARLDKAIPSKSLDHNLLIATWNLRAFGDLTDKWQAAEGDSPKRDKHALASIAEIISRFDVVALQEVRGNLRCLRRMMHMLGNHWGMSLTDITRGRPGNDERMAYLFDSRKLQLSGLACELVVPDEQLSRIGPDALERQFARTPYAVSFRSGSKTFILVTLHVLYGKNAAERKPELLAISQWLADWSKDVNAWDHSIVALGDFNIDRKGDELYDAFTSTGLFVPDDLNQVPRTVFGDPDKPNLSKFYDQIAWFPKVDNQRAFSLKYNRGGSFDFTQAAMLSRGLDRKSLSYRISDHYPLWAEFLVR